MNRKELIAFANANVFPQVESNMLDIDGMKEAIRLISKWRIGKPVNIKMNAKVNDGFLFMNGEPLGRIAAKVPKLNLGNESLYWEGRILARQENV